MAPPAADWELTRPPCQRDLLTRRPFCWLTPITPDALQTATALRGLALKN